MAYVIKVNHADTLRRLTFEKQPGGEDGLSFANLEAKIREMFQFPASAKLKVTYVDKENDVVVMETDNDLKDACVYQSLNPLRLNVVLTSQSANSSGGPSRTTGLNNAFEGLEEPLKDLFQNLRPENVKNMFQAYEPLFRDVRHPSQIPDLVENIVKTAASQFGSLSKNGGASTSTPATSQNETAPEGGTAQVQNEPTDFNGNIHLGVGCDVCGMMPILGNRYKSTIKDDYDLCSSCYAKAGASANEYQVIQRTPFRSRHWRNPRGRMMCPAMGPVGHMPRYPWYACQGMRATQDGQGSRLDARFVRDVSVFDGTELAPGTRFTKIWRLRNSGTAPWPANTKLVNVDGDDLGSAPITPLEIGEQGLAPEEEIEVSVDCVAPQKSGRYQSTWRLATPWGPKFGHKIWVQIQVVPTETLNKPVQMDADGNLQGVQVGETSTAVPRNEEKAVELPQDVKVANPATRESEPVNSVEDSFLPRDVKVADQATSASETVKSIEESFVVPVEVAKSDDLPDVVAVANQATSGSETMNSIEESFVKVDVDNNGDEAPLIQMVDMLSGSSEDEKLETQTASTFGVQETGRADEVVGTPVEVSSTEVPAAKLAESGEVKASVKTDEVDASTFNALLAKLEAMGFSDRALNVALLKANALDLRKTVDALCDVDDWAPALAELAEMGFNDLDVNLHLMFKNQGNLKRVVKELVQLAKKASGRTD